MFYIVSLPTVFFEINNFNKKCDKYIKPTIEIMLYIIYRKERLHSCK